MLYALDLWVAHMSKYPCASTRPSAHHVARLCVRGRLRARPRARGDARARSSPDGINEKSRSDAEPLSRVCSATLRRRVATPASASRSSRHFDQPPPAPPAGRVGRNEGFRASACTSHLLGSSPGISLFPLCGLGPDP